MDPFGTETLTPDMMNEAANISARASVTRQPETLYTEDDGTFNKMAAAMKDTYASQEVQRHVDTLAQQDFYKAAKTYNARLPQNWDQMDERKRAGFIDAMVGAPGFAFTDVGLMLARTERALLGDTQERSDTVKYFQDQLAKNTAFIDDLPEWQRDLAIGFRGATRNIYTMAPGLALAPFGGGAATAMALGTSTMALYGISTYDEFLEQVESFGLDRSEHQGKAVLAGLSEGGFEALSDVFGAKVWRLLGSSALMRHQKRTLFEAFFNFSRKLGITTTGEVLTEMMNASTQAAIGNVAGLPYQDPWWAAKRAFKPSVIQSVMSMGMMGAVSGPLRDAAANADAYLDVYKEGGHEALQNAWDPIYDRYLGKRDRTKMAAEIRMLNYHDRLLDAIGIRKPGPAQRLAGLNRYPEEAKMWGRAIMVNIDLQNATNHAQEFYSKLTPEQQEVVNRSMHIDDNPALAALRDDVVAFLKAFGEDAQKEGVIRQLKANGVFVPRLWESQKHIKKDEHRGGPETRHDFERKYTTIVEGWANGDNLVYTDIFNAVRAYEQDVTRAVQDRNLISTMLRTKIRPGVRSYPEHASAQIENYKDLSDVLRTAMNWMPQAILEATPDKSWPRILEIYREKFPKEFREQYRPGGKTIVKENTYRSNTERDLATGSAGGYNPIQDHLVVNRVTGSQLRMIDAQKTLFHEFAHRYSRSLKRATRVLEHKGFAQVFEETYNPHDVAAYKKDGFTGSEEVIANQFAARMLREMYGDLPLLDEYFTLWKQSYDNRFEALPDDNPVKPVLEAWINNMVETSVGQQPLLSTYPRPGFKKINHKHFKYIEKGQTPAMDPENMPESHGVAPMPMPMKPEVVVHDLYAPKPLAADLNRVLNVSKLDQMPMVPDVVPGSAVLNLVPKASNAIVRKITKYNNIVKGLRLQSTLFHHQAFLRSYYLAIGKDPKGRKLPFDAIEAGQKSIREMSPIWKLGVENGLTLGLNQDWNEQAFEQSTIFGRAISKIPVVGPAKDKIMQVRAAQQEYLFGEMGAGLKMRAFYIKYHSELRKRYGIEATMSQQREVAKNVAQIINDDFGGLHHGRMRRNPTVQHLLNLTWLGADWTESNINTFVRIFKGGDFNSKKMYAGMWAGIVLRGAIWTTVLNYVMSGGDLDDMWEKYEKAKESDNYDWAKVDITPLYKTFGGTSERSKYWNFSGHFLDIPKMATRSPMKTLRYKGSAFEQFTHEAITGVDWRGQGFTTMDKLFEFGIRKEWEPDRGWVEPVGVLEWPSFIFSQLIEAAPVQLQNYWDWRAGELEGFDAVLNSLGVGIDTSYEPLMKEE